MQGPLVRRQSAQEVTRAQYGALVDQRNELQSQMRTLTERRNLLYAESRRASETRRPEIDARMAELDARMARIDGQLEGLNEQISDAIRQGAPSGQNVPTAPTTVREIRIPSVQVAPPGFRQSRAGDLERMVIGGLVTEAVLLVLIGVVAWRWGMKRMREQFERLFASHATQMNQLQQAVDVIGIEVERISEGQRYVARVLSEGSPAAMPGARKELAPSPAVRSREG